MNEETVAGIAETAQAIVTTWGIKVIGALAVLIIGWIVAKWIRASMRKALTKTNMDATLVPFLSSMVYYLLLAFVGPSMNQFHQLDPLPISRRLLFAVLTLPGLLALIASYGAGRIGVALVERPTELVEYRIDERGQYVWVPERFLEVAWGGETPILDAPWGESHPAWSLPLFRGSRARV